MKENENCSFLLRLTREEKTLLFEKTKMWGFSSANSFLKFLILNTSVKIEGLKIEARKPKEKKPKDGK